MSVDHNAIRRELDGWISSIGRIRIIAKLAKNPDGAFTIYAIMAAPGLKRGDVKTNLAKLKAIGWVNKTIPLQSIQLDLTGNRVVTLRESSRARLVSTNCKRKIPLESQEYGKDQRFDRR